MLRTGKDDERYAFQANDLSVKIREISG